MRTIASFHKEKKYNMYQSQQLYLISSFNRDDEYLRTMFWCNKNLIIITNLIFFAKYFCPKNFNFTLDSLIKYLMKIKDK
jgi:hypothetical protein